MQVFKRDVCYLGHVVSETGYKPDLHNIEAITSLREKPPKTIGELRKLLGLLGYYRKYIPEFAKIAKPLTDLLRTDIMGKPHYVQGKRPELCSNETSSDTIDAIINGIKVRTSGDSTLIAAVNANNNAKSLTTCSD
eukprot:gene5085-5741_t